MDLKDLLGVVPELLLLFIPGFISIRIKEKFLVERKSVDFDVTLFSIVYSFIIGIIYSSIRTAFIQIFPKSFSIFNTAPVKQSAYLILAVSLGFFLVKIPNTKLGRKVRKLFNENLSPEPSVWIKAMQNHEGAWATVYLENGLIYTGQLIYYTTEYDSEDKELLLTNYRLAVRGDTSPESPGDFCTIIQDYTNDSNSRVYLTRDVIVAIEIQK